MKIFQKGFNYSQDGDGNRLVYHMQGCNLKCPWCANPEGMQCKGTIVSDPEWILESICPHGAISGTKVDRTICVECKIMSASQNMIQRGCICLTRIIRLTRS